MVTLAEFKKLDLKIAEIEAVEPHPNADKLYVLRIRTGEATKTLVAGIRPYYEESELVGKKIVIVDNLEPATIRGVESQGMLLAASNSEMLTLLVPEKDIPAGAAVR